MDRLAIYLAVLIGACVAGALVIAAFTLGYYSVWAFVVSGAVGLVVAYPAGLWVSRYIKRNDPNWKYGKKARKGGVLPDPNAPEI